MQAGDLVPDDLVVAMVAEPIGREDTACGSARRVSRNVVQAEALDAVMGEGALDMALLIDADENELVARLLKRAEEEGRADDNEATIRNPQQVYQAETAPLVAYYPGHGVDVLVVDGLGTIDEVFGRLVRALAAE